MKTEKQFHGGRRRAYQYSRRNELKYLKQSYIR